MSAHIPTEERNTTSDVASPMLAVETSADAASSDTSENKLKKIARYIKSLLMPQDSIHETIDSQPIEHNLQHLQFVLPRVEVDVDKHVLVSLPMVKACNSILFRTGYSKLCRAFVPNTKPSTLHALQINTVDLCYLVCTKKFGSTRIQTQDGSYIKNETMVTNNKDSMFATIFDLSKIQRLCESQGTEIDYRLVITSYGIAHLQATSSSSSTATTTEAGTRSNRGNEVFLSS